LTNDSEYDPVTVSYIRERKASIAQHADTVVNYVNYTKESYMLDIFFFLIPNIVNHCMNVTIKHHITYSFDKLGRSYL